MQFMATTVDCDFFVAKIFLYSYKRKVENHFYEILLLNEICFKILKKFHLKIYYMKISDMKKLIYGTFYP